MIPDLDWWMWPVVAVAVVVMFAEAFSLWESWTHDCGRPGCDIRRNPYHRHETRGAE